jgi:hypothetical protein
MGQTIQNPTATLRSVYDVFVTEQNMGLFRLWACARKGSMSEADSCVCTAQSLGVAVMLRDCHSLLRDLCATEPFITKLER